MNKLEKAIVKEKKIEFGVGVLFLLPAILGTLSFVWCLCFCPDSSDFGGSFARMHSLRGVWEDQYNNEGGASASPAPIFCGLMAIAGVYMMKDCIRYLFIHTKSKEDSQPETNNG